MLKKMLAAVLMLIAGVAQAATVLVFGDSLSAGYGIDRNAAWPSLLAQKLAQAKSPYTVVNVSVSGETTAGGRVRLPTALKEHAPKVVVLELGANDGLRGLPVKDMQANLAAMIEASKAAGARVLLVGMRMPPNYGFQYARGFEAAFQELSKKFKVPLVPFLFEGMADQREFFQADGLHPTAAAQPRLLETVWDKLGPMLKK